MKFPVAIFVCQPSLSLGVILSLLMTRESFGWSLLPAVQVDATGIYLDQVVAGTPAEVPHLRLAPAPALGRPLTLNPARLNELLQQAAPELVTTNWIGAAQIKITRRTRQLAEAELRDLLTANLQQEYVKDRGELELRFTRPVPTTTIVDEPLTVKILDLPSAGVSANFIARFELSAGDETVGTWQIPVQARIWREVLVAGSPLRRGQLVSEADLARERRDLLTTRDALPAVELDNPALELAENIPTGIPLTTRSLRLRPIIHRGKLADAIVQNGALTLSVRVEVLEDGLPGQTIRVRNLKSKREFRGRVQNEETIYVAL
jgi:flagellar basal body P-ring formation protein FlgA